MPGHGHQDLGSFELHFGDAALFVDPGRGAYGDSEEAIAYTRASAQNALTVNDADPAPVNRPYYDESFRRNTIGPSPMVDAGTDQIRISYHGYARLTGVGPVSRHWRFREHSFTISDRVEGRGHHMIRRWLHTPFRATAVRDGAMIEGGAERFHLKSNGTTTVRAGKRWTAYGIWEPASVICVTQHAPLPYSTTMTIERQK